MANLTTKSVKTWKDNVTKSLRGFEKSLRIVAETATRLSSITQSDDKSLSNRFKDLATLSKTTANSDLSRAIDGFSSEIDTYIKDVQRAEAEAKKRAAANIDQFKELSVKISKLKM